MFKATIAIFFSLLFVTLIAAPTIVVVMGADYDVSILIDSNEEEEKEGKESLNDTEVKVLQTSQKSSSEVASSKTSILEFYSNKYSSTYTELLSPPPEYFIL